MEDSTSLRDLLGSLALAAICAMLWLFVLFRESWILPNWSPHLWYTPAYAIALGALAIGPFLMLALYHWRADDYVLGANAWKLAKLGAVFYVLVFLQLTVLCIAAVELRPSAVRFIIGAPILLVIAGVVGALCAIALEVVFHVYISGPFSWLVRCSLECSQPLVRLCCGCGGDGVHPRVPARHSFIAYSSSRRSFSSHGSSTPSTPASDSPTHGPVPCTRCCEPCASQCACCTSSAHAGLSCDSRSAHRRVRCRSPHSRTPAVGAVTRATPTSPHAALRDRGSSARLSPAKPQTSPRICALSSVSVRICSRQISSSPR